MPGRPINLDNNKGVLWLAVGADGVCLDTFSSRLSLIWQGPIALAVGAGGGCLDIFTLFYLFLLFLPLSGRRPDID